MKNGCANRAESRACSSYPEVKPAIDEVNRLRDEIIKEFYDGRAVPLGYGGEAWREKLA